MRTILLILAGGAIGAVIGGSKVLCADGTCVLTGSWYGGALLGSMVALLAAGGCPACAAATCRVPPEDGDDELNQAKHDHQEPIDR